LAAGTPNFEFSVQTRMSQHTAAAVPPPMQ
jgi:hypothetical protein